MYYAYVNTVSVNFRECAQRTTDKYVVNLAYNIRKLGLWVGDTESVFRGDTTCTD